MEMIKYSVTDAAIAEMKEQYAGMTANTPENYKAVSQAVSAVRSKRIEVEKARKAYKAEALEYGRNVDKEAKRVTTLILEVEDPLKATKQAIDDEKARVKAETARVEQERVDSIKAKITAIEALADNLNALSIEEITNHGIALNKVEITEGEYQEFTAHAAKIRETVLTRLRNRLRELHERKREQETLEKAQAEMVETQAKLDVERKAKEEAERQIAEQQAETKRKKDEEALRIHIEIEAKKKAEREQQEKLEHEVTEKRLNEEAKAREEARRPEQEKLLAWAREDIQKVILSAPVIQDRGLCAALANAQRLLSNAQSTVEAAV